jgi:hypothetical protein
MSLPLKNRITDARTPIATAENIKSSGEHRIKFAVRLLSFISSLSLNLPQLMSAQPLLAIRLAAVQARSRCVRLRRLGRPDGSRRRLSLPLGARQGEHINAALPHGLAAKYFMDRDRFNKGTIAVVQVPNRHRQAF